MFTDKTSTLGGGTGDDTSLEDIEFSTASRTPPPREPRSLRYKVKLVGRISLLQIESDNQVSVTPTIWKSEEYTKD